MKLSKLLPVDQILPELKEETQWGVICELTQHLVNIEQLDSELLVETLESLKQREEMISTGIGYGIAIPHCFSEKIDQVLAVFGRSKMGIDFDSIDSKPAHLIILLVVPQKEYHLHLHTLASIAKMFTSAAIRERLMLSETALEMQHIIDPPSKKSIRQSQHESI